MLTPLQQKIIWVGLATLGLLGTYVPWLHTYHRESVHKEQSAGYHFIFTPPAPQSYAWGVRIDWPRALVPMAVVTLATAAGVAAVRSRPSAIRADERQVEELSRTGR